MTHLPHVQNTWTVGTVLAAATSVTSLLSMLIGGVWFAARLDESTKNIPTLVRQQGEQAQAIAVLQDQQHYTDMRYAEIMAQLTTINQKLDRSSERALDQRPRSN